MPCVSHPSNNQLALINNTQQHPRVIQAIGRVGRRDLTQAIGRGIRRFSRKHSRQWSINTLHPSVIF